MPGWDEANVRDFRAKYDYYHHIKDEHEIAALVPDELVNRKAIAGTPSECAEQIRFIADNGFSSIMLLILGDVERTIKSLADDVLPLL